MKLSIRILALSFIFLFITQLKSQTDTLGPMRKEFWISVAGSSPVSLTLRYKKEISPKTYFKVSLVSLSGSYSDFDNGPGNFPTHSVYYSGGAEVGIERRRHLTSRLSFYHGPSLRLTYDARENTNVNLSLPQPQQKSTTTNFTGAIPYSLGFIFQMYANFRAAIEINPSIYGTYSTSKSNFGYSQNINTGIGFDNKFALFSLVYRY